MPTDRRQTCKNKDCHNQFTRAQGSNRLYCFDCRPERKSASNLRYLPQNAPISADIDENQGPLTRSSIKTLDAAGVLDTWQADAVLVLARHIDEGKGGGSAGVAGAVKAHREAMQVALAIAETEEADVIEMIFGEA